MRPEEILPDGVERTDFDGVTVRKGSVAAFLANARALSTEGLAEASREKLEREILDLLPARRAVGLFDVMSVRDARLADWIDRQHPDVAA